MRSGVSKPFPKLATNADGGLLDIWRREFGAAGSPGFEEARRNFIVSEAG